MSYFCSFITYAFILMNSGVPIALANANSVSNLPQLVFHSPQNSFIGDETEKIEKTFSLNSNGRISIDNFNGSVEIDAWDKNEVKVEAIKFADSIERLSKVQIKFDSKPDYLKVSTEFGTWKNGSRSWNCTNNCRLEVKYKLLVPHNAVLNSVETVNGSVTITNLTNYVKASAVNGSVKASNLRGAADIETVNGTTEVDFAELDSDTKINLSTVNGRVNLVIPSDSDATIKAETVNGSISNEFGLPVRKDKYVGKDLYGKVGEGRVEIKLDSVNGTLNIRRKQDGKNPKPAVNLLNLKDTEDTDDELSIADATATINSQIAKTIKESTKIAVKQSIKNAEMSEAIAQQALKEAEKAIKLSQLEIEVNQSEIQKVTENALKAAQKGLAIGFENNWRNVSIEENGSSFRVNENPKINIDARSCLVTVKGWDKQEVKYRVVKINRGGLKRNIGITVNNSSTEVNINAQVSSKDSAVKKSINNDEIDFDDFDNLSQFRIEVFVPKKSQLRIQTNKEIRVQNISGSLELNGEKGAINIRDSDGKLNLTAKNALVRVIGFNGKVDSRTIDGENYFEGEFTNFSAKNNKGKIVLTLKDDVDATIESNTKLYSETFKLNENANRYVFGNGENYFKLFTSSGELILRSSNELKSN